MNTPVAFAALAFISALGLALFGLVGLMARALVPWGDVADP
jgi:NitT/TauT family transport system permease protein